MLKSMIRFRFGVRLLFRIGANFKCRCTGHQRRVLQAIMVFGPLGPADLVTNICTPQGRSASGCETIPNTYFHPNFNPNVPGSSKSIGFGLQ